MLQGRDDLLGHFSMSPRTTTGRTRALKLLLQIIWTFILNFYSICPPSAAITASTRPLKALQAFATSTGSRLAATDVTEAVHGVVVGHAGLPLEPPLQVVIAGFEIRAAWGSGLGVPEVGDVFL